MAKRSEVKTKIVMLPIEIQWQQDGDQVVMNLPGYNLKQITVSRENFEAAYTELCRVLYEAWGVELEEQQ